MSTLLRRDVYLASLPTKAAFRTAQDNSPVENRELVFVRITTSEGAEGWGECSALTLRGYTNEWARGAFGLLASGFKFDASLHPMASSALEMARLDIELRAAEESFASYLGSTRSMVTAGATLGLFSVDQTLSGVSELESQGYRRVKLKISPEMVGQAVVAVAERHPRLELQVDANGSLDSSHLAELASLPVAAIEQPFALGEVQLNSRLRQATSALVLADEETRAVAGVEALAHFDGIVLKPGPLGGIKKAIDWAQAASQANLRVAAGGMLESGLGRHVLAAVASLDPFTISGDLSPARRWLTQDPWADLTMIDGQVQVPTSVGLSPALDLEMLDHFTVAKAQVPLG